MKAHINPAVLRWAREKAQLPLESAARKAGISDTLKQSAAERLGVWEDGADVPTRNQLASLAKAYYRPVLTFYLQEPPAQAEQLSDFRTVGDHPADGDNNILAAFTRKMRARQREIVQLIADDGDEPEPLPFIGRLGVDSSPREVVDDIREVLGFPFELQRGMNDRDGLFRALRARAEAVGIFVIIQGNLGSYKTNIEPEAFRGIAFADPVAPFIIINGNDAKAARTFTLMHELAHLWLGEEGISNLSPFAGNDARGGLEAFCNAVAAEFLLPRGFLVEAWDRVVGLELPEAMVSLASQFKVSRAAVANRLWKLNRIDEVDWWALYATYQDEWRRQRVRMQEQEGGPTFYITKQSQLGAALIRTVLGGVDAGNLTYTRASRILGVNAKNFDGLRAGVG
ncbi:MAG: ImmA/IrrE family metallo-endopeptidase [Rhodospirillaceae bacterium]|nr:ImmA/IrrE family metallo-endopeptidase [Rhodospirillaceae bacterium]MBT3884725.1 ImmA/IrrE family metallo-endopeptidase [Rhodospirillaceae bacterium]MBT4118328.1 ImmA/IrrE family metallo-endopeptidase [Rhodospirillaceae bacterium]MBT4671285.1 ImmA/IrrE family metallo-endopeptidase [Rhodospirillaceae bacterium]MBT4750922.1 ImmA/IrrE family metallo-endopeptidase [Rhodospirillaceae bacterium]